MPKLSKEEMALRAAAELELRRRREREYELYKDQRESLAKFCCYLNPSYVIDPIHDLMSSELEKVMSGETKRLIITCQPQVGKSQMASIYFPAFWMGHNPNKDMILSSYNDDLASDKSKQVRAVIVSEEYRKLFPMHSLRVDTRASGMWRLATPFRGAMKVAGVGGGITGFGAELAIIDDPFKDWQDAQSAFIRDAVWRWYLGVFRTRVREGGAIIIIMCMTGDTPVLMADGTERQLRNVKVGDRVATYDNGKLTSSIVLNHKSSGPDSIYKIKTTCGKIVHANERHPFLVEEDGQFKWIQLKNLTTDHKIVILKDNGVSGKAKNVLLTTAKNQLFAEDIAAITTTTKEKKMGIALHQTFRDISATYACDSVMALPLLNMTQCLQSKTEDAPSANDCQKKVLQRIGIKDFALTMTTKLAKFVGFCVSTATILCRILTPRKYYSPPLNTSSFTTTRIKSIDFAGIKEVFDLQVDRTENFIANGLVSHNTRWHEDDLVGRLLQSDGWNVVRVPAFAETDEERIANNRFLNIPIGPDPLGRAPGEVASPRRFSKKTMEEIKTDVGPMVWAAEYQQVPRALEGNRLKREWFNLLVDVTPPIKAYVRYWDKAGTAYDMGQKHGAATAGILLGIDADNNVYVIDAIQGWWSALQRENAIKDAAKSDAEKYGHVKIYIEQEPGSGGKESVDATIRNLSGYAVYADKPTGDKDQRLEPFAAQAEAGHVLLVRGPWNLPYIEELISVPNGLRRDQADATAGAFNWLTAKQLTAKRVPFVGLYRDFTVKDMPR